MKWRRGSLRNVQSETGSRGLRRHKLQSDSVQKMIVPSRLTLERQMLAMHKGLIGGLLVVSSRTRTMAVSRFCSGTELRLVSCDFWVGFYTCQIHMVMENIDW